MNYTEKEIKSGFASFHKLVLANKDKIFELEMPLGDVILVKYDLDFEDDSYSTDQLILKEEDVENFYTISFEVVKVVENMSKSYKEGEYILINQFNTPASYKII